MKNERRQQKGEGKKGRQFRTNKGGFTILTSFPKHSFLNFKFEKIRQNKEPTKLRYHFGKTKKMKRKERERIERKREREKGRSKRIEGKK